MAKARVLELLRASVPKCYVVDPFVAFSVNDWATPECVLDRIKDGGLAEVVVVRSSTTIEGLEQRRSAGAFLSLLNVKRERSELRGAIQSVIESYGRDGRTPTPDDRVIVQSQVIHVRLSGVLTTLTRAGLPYLTVEYDVRGDTTSVPRGDPCATVIIGPEGPMTSPWETVFESAKEIASVMGESDLVVEFALDEEGGMHVFQAWSRGRSPVASTRDVLDRQLEADLQFRHAAAPVLSTMADWNPAEMLGRSPNLLATSLYESLITDWVWATARAQLGYTHVPGPLLVTIAGTPYIDVARSLRSLTPAAGISARLRDALVDAQLTQCAHRQESHDKVEWEIAASSAILSDDDARLAQLQTRDRTALRGSLSSLTARILASARTLESGNLARIRALRTARRRLQADPERTTEILAALETARTHGTLPFAKQARIAFLLRDLVAQGSAMGVLPAGALERTLSRARTPASALNSDLLRVRSGILSREALAARYGHLRPSTYDVTSPRYDASPILDGLLETTGRSMQKSHGGASRLVVEDFTDLLRANHLDWDGSEVLELLASAMSARERLKFEFTAVVSDVIESLARIGERSNIDRHGVGQTSLSDVLARDFSPREPREWQIPTPDVFTAVTNLNEIHLGDETPSFAGIGRFTGPPVPISDEPGRPPDLSGRVVLIESAEPGKDWIFATGLGALVTAYGGSASHMAIRAAEFGLPVAVGCGRSLLNKLATAPLVHIDTEQQVIRSVR